jgi:hypothetical protein
MQRQSSRRAAAAGVAAAVRAVAAVGGADGQREGYSPGPSFEQGWDAAVAPAAAAGPAAGGSKGGGGRRRAGSSGRNSSKAADSEDSEFWDLTDEESDEGATAWGGGEDEEEDGACFGGTVLGGGYTQNDYSSLSLKPDHYNRPLWVCSDGRIFLETYSPIYKQVGWWVRVCCLAIVFLVHATVVLGTFFRVRIYKPGMRLPVLRAASPRAMSACLCCLCCLHCLHCLC